MAPRGSPATQQRPLKQVFVGHACSVTRLHFPIVSVGASLSRYKRDLRVNDTLTVGHACSVTEMCFPIVSVGASLSRYKRDLRVNDTLTYG
jgi:hypothetical protein